MLSSFIGVAPTAVFIPVVFLAVSLGYALVIVVFVANGFLGGIFLI